MLGGVRVSASSVLIALGVVVIGFASAAWIAGRVRGPGPVSSRWRATVAQIVGHSVRALSIAVGLQIAGIDIGTVLAAGAVLAVGVGIAMQDVAVNFVSGVILLAERTIREGDIIEFDGRIARVRVMGLRATIAEALDGDEIIVPNSILAQNPVKNLTLSEDSYRLRVRVGVSYRSDIELAEKALLEAARSMSWGEKKPQPIVLLMDFAPSAIDFEISVWTRDVWGLRRRQSDLRKAIWANLARAGISIPLPQLDIHVDVSPESPPSPSRAS